MNVSSDCFLDSNYKADICPEVFRDITLSKIRICVEIVCKDKLGHESLIYFHSDATALDTNSFDTIDDKPAQTRMEVRL